MSKSSRSKILLLWLLAGAFEWPFFQVLFGTQSGFLNAHPVLSVTLHLAGTSLLFLAQKPLAEKGRQSWSRVFILFTVFMPVLGWAMAALFLVLYTAPDGLKWLLVDELEDDDDVEPDYYPEANLSHRHRVLENLDFIPLADILAGEDLNLKRGAIEKLSKLKTPDSIKMLLTYRSDPSAEVRFYVTTSLSRIKKEFDEELEAAKKEMERDVHRLASRVSLAKTYLWYASSNLLDETGRKAYEKEAVYHLRHVIQTETPIVDAFWMLICFFMDSQQWDQALATLLALEKAGLGDREEIAKIKIRLHYHMGRYGEVAKQFKKESSFQDSQWKTLAQWWGGDVS